MPPSPWLLTSFTPSSTGFSEPQWEVFDGDSPVLVGGEMFQCLSLSAYCLVVGFVCLFLSAAGGIFSDDGKQATAASLVRVISCFPTINSFE